MQCTVYFKKTNKKLWNFCICFSLFYLLGVTVRSRSRMASHVMEIVENVSQFLFTRETSQRRYRRCGGPRWPGSCNNKIPVIPDLFRIFRIFSGFSGFFPDFPGFFSGFSRIYRLWSTEKSPKSQMTAMSPRKMIQKIQIQFHHALHPWDCGSCTRKHRSHGASLRNCQSRIRWFAYCLPGKSRMPSSFCQCFWRPVIKINK